MAATTIQKSKNSINQRRLRKLMKNKLAMFGLILTLVIVLMCMCAPLLTDYDPTYMDMSLRYAEPSAEHPFGCDQGGRDVFARILYGGRISILIGLACALAANVLGAMLGCVAGYMGNKADQVIMFIGEIVACFPSTMLVLIVQGFSGQGVGIMMGVFILTGWVSTMRLTRSQILSVKQETFVESCRANGIGKVSIMFKHLLPNVMGPFIVNITMNVGGYVLSEAGLSFLGLGVPKGIPTWGNMLEAARSVTTMTDYPALWIVPGVAISLFVLGVNFFGDGLRDALDVSD